MRPGTETKLLDAADALFFTRGIAATSIDDVLERAGVSSATLYRGYASKEDLVGAALARRHARWLEVWDDVLAGTATPREELFAVFDALEAFQREPLGSRWCAFLGSAAEYVDAPDTIRQAIELDTRTIVDRLRQAAVPLVGDAGAVVLAEELLLVVTGHLAMLLRRPAADASTARAVAVAVVDAAEDMATSN